MINCNINPKYIQCDVDIFLLYCFLFTHLLNKVLIIIFCTKGCVFKNVYAFISVILSALTTTVTVYRGDLWISLCVRSHFYALISHNHIDIYIRHDKSEERSLCQYSFLIDYLQCFHFIYSIVFFFHIYYAVITYHMYVSFTI